MCLYLLAVCVSAEISLGSVVICPRAGGKHLSASHVTALSHSHHKQTLEETQTLAISSTPHIFNCLEFQPFLPAPHKHLNLPTLVSSFGLTSRTFDIKNNQSPFILRATSVGSLRRNERRCHCCRVLTQWWGLLSGERGWYLCRATPPSPSSSKVKSRSGQWCWGLPGQGRRVARG